MARFPSLMKNRCGVYCYRLVLPHAIRALPHSPKEIRFSLATKDKATAIERYLLLYPEIRQLVTSLRKNSEHGTIAMEMNRETIRHWRETLRLKIQKEAQLEAASRATLDANRARIKKTQEAEHARMAQAALKKRIIELNNERLILTGQVKALSGTSSGGSTPAHGEQAMRLHQLVERFLAFEAEHSTNRPSTQQARQRYLHRFLDIVGYDIPITALDAHHLRHYRDIVHMMPKNLNKQGFAIPADKTRRPAWFAATIKAWHSGHPPSDQRLAGGGVDTAFKNTRALLKWARAEHYITQDLASLLVVSKKRAADTKTEAVPFTPAQLAQLFPGGYLYGDVRRRGERPHDWQFWVPLVGLTTGMRSDEIGSLLVSDLHQIEGMWCLRVRDSKSPAGIRTIPVPGSLLRAGLLGYRKGLIEQGGEDGRLFPTLSTKGGSYSNRIGAFFNYNKNRVFADGTVRYDGYMVKTDVSSPSDKQRQSFHSLRHGLVTLLLATRLPSTGEPLPLDLVKNQVGHGIDFAKTYGIATDSWDDVTTKTYNHRDHAPLTTKTKRLALMKEALDAIDFGIDLSGITFARFRARKKPAANQ